ncbi:MAG: hypothetical protein A2028_01410 [Candidatus Aminicenantes bacterium RBG_19FT_COMBO_59_29]|nr:MAG: hypothetical protein A2028_01410 [Candidatus Aminicenantes bacterium RBG_19FT_COMBO_59_29]
MINSRTRSSLLCLAIAAVLVLSARTASAELVAKLPQVMNPFFLTIADGRIYVVEDSVAVHIYTLDPKGVSFVKTFGRKGQGPGEFDYIYTIRPFKDHLDIPGSHKLARFSLDGDYISEVAVTVGVFKGAVYRLGDGYVARDLNFDEKGSTTTIRLYDKDFKLVKEIGARTASEGLTKINLVADYFAPRVAGDRLYVIDAAEDSVVTVYDRNGVPQKEIRLPLEPLKMTDALKAAVIKPLKESWTGPTRWEDFEKRLFFPNQTPGLDHFEVLDGKLVARTYNYRQDKVEFALLDEQGRELRRLDLPFTGRLSNGILFCFYQGRYYYLRENPEEEVWELHAEKAW